MLGNIEGGTKKHQVRSANLSSLPMETVTPIAIPRAAPMSDSPSPRFTSLFPLQDDVIESPMSMRTKRRLLAFNLLLSIFHITFAVFVGIGIGDYDTKLDLLIPTYKTTLSMGATGSGETQRFFVPVYSESGGLYITWLTMSFFGLSGFFHLAACLFYPRTYLSLIDHKICPFRWLESTFSAAIMYLAIAFPTGILNRETLICGFGLIATTMFFGLLCEYLARPASGDTWSNTFVIRATPHVLGYVPQSVAWFIIFLQFMDRSAEAPEPPSFVYALVITELCLFFSFGLIQLYQQLSPPSKYINGEFAYITMSFVAKGSLGAILLTNVLFLSNFDCIINSDAEGC